MGKMRLYTYLAILFCANLAAQIPGALGTIPQQPPNIPPAAPGSPAARDPAPKSGTAVIRGRVVAGDDGRPLRRAQVRLTSPELRESRLSSTDAQGRYEFKELPAGRYSLTATKESFVSVQYGQLRPFEAGRPVEVRDGQQLDRIDFSLPRGSVIVGRVVDEFGDPVMDVQVSAMRYQYVQGRRRLTPASRTVMTNDIGEFRLFGLSPGQYYLSATLRDSVVTAISTGLPPDLFGSGGEYAPTYYPGTTRVSEAERITLAVGQVLSDMTIPLSPTRTARVSGTVVSADGKIVTAGAVMSMVKGEISLTSMSPGQIRPDGSFTLTGLAPGDYSLIAVLGNPISGGMEFATSSVTVAGDDVTGVQLAAFKAVTVSGRVVLDPSAEKSFQAAATNLMTIPADPDVLPLSTTTPAKINNDYTFELKVAPGRALVRLGPAPGGFVIRAVRLGVRDVTDTGLDITPNEDVSGLEIELTNQATTVTGLVTDSRGQRLKDYFVVIFPPERERWSSVSRHIAVGRADQDGRFRARVPGGNYYAVALDYIEPGEQFDPDFLDRLREIAISFSVAPSETKSVDLKLAARP